ncbi:MAG: hypothetical protein MUO64_03465 [Anaerolineales bacterium]|nr:hypothetical protein [Anaerolineales bacterium]
METARSDTALQRSILLSARYRFSSPVQPLKILAADKITEQNLLSIDRPLRMDEIINLKVVSFGNGVPRLSPTDTQQAVEHLSEAGRLTVIGHGHRARYSLSDQARSENLDIRNGAERNFHRVVATLFKNLGSTAPDYAPPFLECLCIIFSELADEYVRLFSRRETYEDFLRFPIVQNVIDDVTTRHPAVDRTVLRDGVFTFFRQPDIIYDSLKWNLAQNSFIAKAPGLDPGGLLLSEELFGKSIFYLDTNVIIPALEGEALYHEGFRALAHACGNLQIELKVCQISIAELRRLEIAQRTLIPKLIETLPEDAELGITGDFIEKCLALYHETGHYDLDDLFSSLADPIRRLDELYSVKLIDAAWFLDSVVNDPTTKALSEKIKEEYLRTSNRKKSDKTALHDALLLRWIQMERERTDNRIWLITRDKSLPNIRGESSDATAPWLSITLDAILQWISPLAMSNEALNGAAAVFSESVKYQLLPRETFFQTEDLLFLAEMAQQTKELPAEDVKGLIQYLITNAPHLDPGKPADRDILALEMARYFASPGRKYKQEVQRLESSVQALASEVDRLKTEKSEAEVASLRRDAYHRIILVALLVIGLEVAVAFVSNLYGEGPNFIQRMVNSWPLFAGGLTVGIVLCWFALRKERLRRVLPWPLKKLLMLEDDKEDELPSGQDTSDVA